MWDLFKSEALRFRGWTVAVASVHLVALIFMTRMEDLAQQRLFVHTAFAGLYAVIGSLLGLYQMSSYRRPSQWLNLLHRPLPRLRIAAAIAAAGMLQLVVVVALPLLLMAVLQETTTARVVDLRHWMLPVSALLVAACAYLAGAFCTLRGPIYAIAALPLLWWLPLSNAYGFGMLAVQLIVLCWLALLLLDAFRPDLSTPPRGIGAIVTALPLQMGVYALAMVLFVGTEMVWIAQGSHPDNTATPPAGGHNELEIADPRSRMLAGLAGSQHPEVPRLRDQIQRASPRSMSIPLPPLPQRNELSNFRLAEFNDETRHVRWVFSHDDMRLHGLHLADGSGRGTLGIGGTDTPFPALLVPAWAPPGMVGDDLLLTGGDTLYQLVLETQQVIPRIRVDPGEILVAVSTVGQSIGVMSDRALYFYPGGPRVKDHTLLTPRLRLPLPGKVGDLRNLELIELQDGYLADFVYSARSSGPMGSAPFQILLRTHEDGRVETINRRALRFDYPALYRYRAWWISPVLYVVREAARGLFAPAFPLDITDPAPMPRSMWWLAGVLAILSLATAVWRTASAALSLPARVAWIATCGLMGLPALASLWLMHPAGDTVRTRKQAGGKISVRVLRALNAHSRGLVRGAEDDVVGLRRLHDTRRGAAGVGAGEADDDRG
jgi:hypothetical protein